MSDSLQLGLEHSFANELEGLYVPYTPEGFPSPELLQLNHALLEELGLASPEVEARAAELFSGTLLPADAQPLAQLYAGHQFGGFSPQLGDGRATLLGERLDTKGQRKDLQLKGSGRTPLSRGADGKAVIGPILREYLLGEAMHVLGVPTTRVLAAVATGEKVWRESRLPGAVLTRVAASHLRIGTLEFFAAHREPEKLSRLVEYTLRRHFPERSDRPNPARELLEGLATVQAQLIAEWMHVGFIHGVMNTDNMSLSGETLDYGPCAFMDHYDPKTVFSSIDHGGRYAYGNQPGIGQWNLARACEAVLPMLADDEEEAVAIAQEVLSLYVETYRRSWLSGMREKLGLEGEQDGDQPLADDLLAWMQAEKKDFTSTWRGLTDSASKSVALFGGADFTAWHGRWQQRLGSADRAQVETRMKAKNPIYVARNHLVEEALEAASTGDLAPFRTLLEVLLSPFEEQPGRERFAEPAPGEFGPYRTFCGT